MNKVKTQIEFLYLQIESLDELSFQALKSKTREAQIRVMIFSAAMIMVRTSTDKVSYDSIEHCNALIDNIVKKLFPAIANGINKGHQIKQEVGKYGDKMTIDRLEKNVVEVVADCYKGLLELFSLPENYPGVLLTGKGGDA